MTRYTSSANSKWRELRNWSTTSRSQQGSVRVITLRHLGYIELPPNQKKGGFDHAAIHLHSQTLYVAHTSNDAVDVVDCKGGQYLRSITGLPGVAGVLVSNEKALVFTSNRGEDTVGVFAQGKDSKVEKVTISGRPNGLAFNPSRGMLLAANVSGPEGFGAITASIVDVNERMMVADVKVPGRTRWTVYDPESNRFYVNISSPSQIAVIDGEDPDGLTGSFQIPAVGPHGLELDGEGRRLFCACDDGGLYDVDLESETVSRLADLAGQPDVIFHNSNLGHLYVAIGDPGIIQVFDTEEAAIAQTLKTEFGTHTIAPDQGTNRVYAFIPGSHRASAFVDD